MHAVQKFLQRIRFTRGGGPRPSSFNGHLSAVVLSGVSHSVQCCVNLSCGSNLVPLSLQKLVLQVTPRCKFRAAAVCASSITKRKGRVMRGWEVYYLIRLSLFTLVPKVISSSSCVKLFHQRLPCNQLTITPIPIWNWNTAVNPVDQVMRNN